MLPSRLAVWLFVASLALLPLGVLFSPFRGLLLLVFVDAALAKRSTQLRVRRDRPARLSLGTDNEISIVVDNLGDRGVSLILRDQPPPQFRAEPGLLDCRLDGHQTVRLNYK